MNDRSKFRWFDKKLDFMAKVISFNLEMDYGYMRYSFAHKETPDDEVDLSDGILMQSIGIEDYNDKLLYEHDIVKVKIKATKRNKERFGINKDQFRLATIVWDEDNCGFKFEFEPNEKWHPCYECYTFGSSEFYIVGNKFENPELLTKKSENDKDI